MPDLRLERLDAACADTSARRLPREYRNTVLAASSAEAPRRLSEPQSTSGRTKVGGMEVSDAERLNALEKENAQLNRLLADSLLNQAALKGFLLRKW